MEYRNYLITHLPEFVLATVVLFYITYRIVGRIEQKRLGIDNFERWAYRGLVDMYRNQGYPYPEIEARDKIYEIIKEYKYHVTDDVVHPNCYE